MILPQTIQALAVIALCGCAAAACRRAVSPEEIRREWERIPPLSSTGQCDFDLRGDKTDTVFTVLGALEEYNGRQIVEHASHIERFYCNEPGVSRWFRDLLSRLADEQGINSGIRTETYQDCLTSYVSPPIAKRLNSCYRYTFTADSAVVWPYGTSMILGRMTWGTLSIDLFLRGPEPIDNERALPDSVFYRQRAVAYVAGAWARYRYGPEFRFANSQAKVQLLARLLTYLGCLNVRVQSDSGLIPQTHWIAFEPPEEIKRRLDNVRAAAISP